jgi:hypothetical protein
MRSSRLAMERESGRSAARSNAGPALAASSSCAAARTSGGWRRAHVSLTTWLPHAATCHATTLAGPTAARTDQIRDVACALFATGHTQLPARPGGLVLCRVVAGTSCSIRAAVPVGVRRRRICRHVNNGPAVDGDAPTCVTCLAPRSGGEVGSAVTTLAGVVASALAAGAPPALRFQAALHRACAACATSSRSAPQPLDIGAYRRAGVVFSQPRGVARAGDHRQRGSGGNRKADTNETSRKMCTHGQSKATQQPMCQARNRRWNAVTAALGVARFDRGRPDSTTATPTATRPLSRSGPGMAMWHAQILHWMDWLHSHVALSCCKRCMQRLFLQSRFGLSDRLVAGVGVNPPCT